MSTPEIRTDRLVFARLEPGDAAVFHGYRADPAVTRYQMWAPASLEEAARFIDDQQRVDFDTPGTWFQFALRLRDSGRLVGDLGMRFPAGDPHQVELGVTIAPGEQRRGYGTEALRGALDFLLKAAGKHRVFASVDPRNAASLAMLKRIGMRQEAYFRQSILIRGEWVDDVVYGILESEWSGA